MLWKSRQIITKFKDKPAGGSWLTSDARFHSRDSSQWTWSCRTPSRCRSLWCAGSRTDYRECQKNPEHHQLLSLSGELLPRICSCSRTRPLSNSVPLQFWGERWGPYPTSGKASVVGGQGGEARWYFQIWHFSGIVHTQRWNVPHLPTCGANNG